MSEPRSPDPNKSDQPHCSPLCGASKAYGRFDRPWQHEPQCPVRLAWEAAGRPPGAPGG